jgi:hypothetical protein
MMDVQVSDGEAKLSLYWTKNAQKQKKWGNLPLVMLD